MIGVEYISLPDWGRLSVRYSRVDGAVRILQVTDVSGTDVITELKIQDLQSIKFTIEKLK